MAFSQIKNWTLLPHQVNIEYNQPLGISTIPNVATGQFSTANGVYDENDNLIFFVKDEEVYDAAGNNIGQSSWGTSGFLMPETVIVPVPGECRKYYVIQSHTAPLVTLYIEYVVVDASNPSNITVSSIVQVNGSNNDVGNFCGLAATKIISGSGTSAIRYLYSMSESGLFRYTISNSGIASETDLTTSAISSASLNTTELDINPDGTLLLWGDYFYGGSGEVYEVPISNLNNVTTYTLPFQFGCSVDHDITGVEYDNYDNIWVSAYSSCGPNNGVYKITKGSPPSYLPIANTSNCNRSQIELLNTGHLLVVNNNQQIGELNVTSNTYSQINIVGFSLNSKGNYPFIYALNDQIDGEDYSIFNGVQAFPTASFKIDNVTPATNCGAIQNTYNCNAITLSNQSTGASSYVLNVVSIDGNCDPDGNYNYSSGTITSLPTDLRNMPGAGGTYLASNQGSFLVELIASNGCNEHSVESYIQVNNPPTAVTSCFTFANNTTCSGSGIPGGSSCSSAVSVCSNSPKIKGDCSGGQFTGGTFDIRIDRFSSCLSFF